MTRTAPSLDVDDERRGGDEDRGRFLKKGVSREMEKTRMPLMQLGTRDLGRGVFVNECGLLLLADAEGRVRTVEGRSNKDGLITWAADS